MAEIKIHCKYDALVPLEGILPNPQNPNDHSEAQIERLAKLFQYEGIRHPIIVSRRTGLIAAGHGRKMAAMKLGMTHYPVDYQDFESHEQEASFVVSDNAIALWAELDFTKINTQLADFDPEFDLEHLGFKDFRIDGAEPEAEEGPLPGLPSEPKTKRGDLYKLGNHFLLCGDSTSVTDVERLFGSNKAEICFTSPPYADQREYNGTDKDLSTENLKKFITSSFNLCNYYVVNLGYMRKNKEVFPYWNEYIDEAKACDLRLLSWNIWNRNKSPTLGAIMAMFPIEHEWIFVFGKDVKELNCTIENKYAGTMTHGTTRHPDGSLTPTRQQKIRSHRPIGTVYNGDIQRYVGEENKHPAMFPVEFPMAYIEAMTNSGDFVYEPFCGSGSTIIACEQTGRNCLAMEIDEKYCDLAVERYEKLTGTKAELLIT